MPKDSRKTVPVRLTAATGYGVLVFLLLPLTIAQFFLFAWAGEIGYHGRWVFLWIGFALCVDLMIAPVSSFIQALGRTDLEASMVLRGLAVHLALAALLIGRFGKNGAAAACALGMVFAHASYVRRFHLLMEWRLVETVKMLGREFRPGDLISVESDGDSEAFDRTVDFVLSGGMMSPGWTMNGQADPDADHCGSGKVNAFVCG